MTGCAVCRWVKPGITVAACSSARLAKRMLEGGQRRIRLVDRVADIEPEIGRDLVVAGARGVQPPRGRPDQFGKPALDIHMDVFERALELERALADF